MTNMSILLNHDQEVKGEHEFKKLELIILNMALIKFGKDYGTRKECISKKSNFLFANKHQLVG